MGYVTGRFDSTQKGQFALAREECEKLQAKLPQAGKRQASEAFKKLNWYALIAAKGMDYQSSVQLLKYLLTDYLPGCSDKHLAESARKTVGLILDRLVNPLFVMPDFRNGENCKLAREQVLQLCQERNFEPLTLMGAGDKELLMYYLIKQLVNSRRYDQLSGFFETFAYEDLVQRSLTEKQYPKAPWCARLYWLVAAHYTDKLSFYELAAEFDRIDAEIKPFADQSAQIKRAYLVARCNLRNLYKSADDENAMEKINQLIDELQSCPHNVIAPSPYKEQLIASVWKSKIKMHIEEGQLQEADDLLKKVSETEKKYQIQSIKTEVLKTRLKRVAIGNHPRDPKDREMIQQEIARLRLLGGKYPGLKLEIANCYAFLDDKEAAQEELKHFTGGGWEEVVIRRAIFLSDLKRYSEAIEILRPLLDSGYSQDWKALTTQAVILANWANDGYEIKTETGKASLADADREKYLLESFKLFGAAIKCGPASYSGGWGGLGHLCGKLATGRLLDFRKYRHLLPQQIQHATGWRDAARKAFSIEKGQTPEETARIQSGLKQALPNELYSAVVKR